MSFSDNQAVNNVLSPINSDSDEFSICCWFKTDNPSSTQTFITGRQATGNGLALFLYNKQIRLDTGSQHIFSEFTLDDTDWHFLCVTRSASSKKSYIDGELIGSTTTVGNMSTVRTTATIGGSEPSATGTATANWFKGNLSDYRIYMTELSAEDVKQLYESRARTDKNGNFLCNEFVENCDKIIINKKYQLESNEINEPRGIDYAYGIGYNASRGDAYGQSFSFTPSTDNNSTYQFLRVHVEDDPNQNYHLSMTVDWNNFDRSNTSGTFTIYWQEYYYDNSDSSYKWGNTTIGNALNADMELINMVLSAGSGIYQYEVDFKTSSKVSNGYLRVRSNYSNGIGTIKFSNISIIPKKYYFSENGSKAKIWNNKLIANQIIEV